MPSPTDTPPPTVAPQPYPHAPASRPSVAGRVGLILACVGAALAVFGPLALFAWIFTLPALILGIVGLSQQGRKKGTSLAAVLTSSVAFLVAAVFSIFWLATPHGPEAQDPGSVTPSPRSSESRAPESPKDKEPARNERFNLPMSAGQEGVIYGYDKKPAVTFKVTEIVRNPDCRPDPMWPVHAINGELVAVKIEMTTAADYVVKTGSADSTRLSWQEWSGVAADGKKMSNSPGGITCYPQAEHFPIETPAGETVSGWWTLDLKPGAKSIAWRPDDVSTWQWAKEHGGWEWSIPGNN